MRPAIGLREPYYTTGKWTFGAAGYTEQSRSEETYGGKIGASYKFN